MCPDPDLISNNCDGETSTAQIGTAPASGTPNKRFVVVKRDNRTIVNDDGIAAPGNNGDLPGGLKVNLCSEDAEQPWAARQTGTPTTNTGGNPAPTGANPANAIRIQQAADGSDCGLLVSPPKFTAVGNFPRVSIAANANPTSSDPPANGPKIATLVLTNPDTVPRLFRVKGRFSFISHMVANNTDTLVELIYRSRLNNDAGNHLSTVGGVPFVGGGSLNSRVVTMGYPEGNYAGYPLNDQREFVDEVILDAGVTRYLHFYTSTIRAMNVFTAADTDPDRGVNIAGVSIEEVYAVGGA